MSEQAPAGWYPDGQGNERYWDGTGWTENVRANTAPPPLVAQPVEKLGAISKLGAAVKKAASDRQQAKDELARQHAADVAAAGELLTSGAFGASTIEIYEHGFVRIAEGSEDDAGVSEIKSSTPFERLSSISYVESEEDRAASVTSASASSVLAGTIGNAVNGILSGGKSLMKGSVPGLAVAGLSHIASTASRRAILTVVTNKAIHTLSNQYRNSVGLKVSSNGYGEVARALIAAGDSALGVNSEDTRRSPLPSDHSESSVTVASAAAAPTLSERLRELSALHKDGILSDEEFASSKARLLNGL